MNTSVAFYLIKISVIQLIYIETFYQSLERQGSLDKQKTATFESHMHLNAL